jgi:hypothetical protein
MFQHICWQLATVGWQQPPVGNDKNDSRSSTLSLFSQVQNTFIVSHEVNVSNLTLSKICGFNRSRMASTGVRLVNKTCVQASAKKK